MRTRTLLSGAICLCLAVVSIHVPFIQVASADSPTTQSSDEPAADSPMRLWFTQLTDTDPKIRDKAKIDLMGIPASDLPKLRQLVIDHQPISPTQVAELRDIVLQSFLASQTYRSAETGEDTDASGTSESFFLGVLWSLQGPVAPVAEVEVPRLGVTVDERLPGFPSYRLLQRGDMILGVFKYPDRPLLELPNCETHTRDQLIQAIKSLPLTQKVVLQVLREGETIQVPVKMAPRPMQANDFSAYSIRMFNADRMVLAEKYWQDNFAPLLDSQIEASNLAEAP